MGLTRHNNVKPACTNQFSLNHDVGHGAHVGLQATPFGYFPLSGRTSVARRSTVRLSAAKSGAGDGQRD